MLVVAIFSKVALVIVSAYTDFFPPHSCLSRYHNYNSQFYIQDCSFNSLTVYSGHGGAIYHDTDYSNCVIEDCLFYQCKCTLHGGGVYMIPSKGGAVVNRVCASDCYCGSDGSTSYYGQFVYSLSMSTSKNIIQYTSVIFSSPITPSYRRSPIYLNNGQVIVRNVNSSNNWLRDYGGIHIQNANSLSINYTSLSNNYMVTSTVLFIQTCSSVNTFTFSNVINNTSPTISIIYTVTSNLDVNNVVFSQNANTLFAGQMTVYNCYISHTAAITSGSAVTMMDIYTITNTFAIMNFGTAMCITPTPDPTTIPPETPFEQGVSPCATPLPPPTPPQSLPPSPSDCLIAESNSLGSVLTINTITSTIGLSLSLLIFY